MAIHFEAELVPARGREDQDGDIEAEVAALQTVCDDDVRKRCPAHELFPVEVHQIDLELVRTFGVRQAEIESQVLMLKREGAGLQMSEDSNEAFLLRQAVLDHLIADEERLYAWLCDFRHPCYPTRNLAIGKRFLQFDRLGTNRLDMAKPLIERKTPRYQMQVRIFFASGSEEGEGVVQNLSKGGCCVTSETTVPEGAEFNAWIYFPDHEWPLKIERAVVRWTKADQFGLQFLELQPAQKERLRTVLAGKKFRIG
jgi:hypothetical protein